MALPWIFVSKSTNSKHQITNKSQISIFNDENFPGQDIVWIFEFWSPVLRSSLLRRMDWNLPFDLAQGGESFDFAQDREPVERLIEPFDIWDLIFGISISQ